MWVLPVVLLIIIIAIIWEYRIRKPDQFILYESGGAVKTRKARFYPRHFSLALSAATYALTLKFEADARGKIPVVVSLAAAIAAAEEHLSALIRTGGWNKDAVGKAGKELEILLQSTVAAFCEKYEIEELSSDALTSYLNEKIGKSVAGLGVDILSLTVQAVDPVDEEIAEAMQQREASRIMEQTETEKQRARVAAAKAKIEADEKISLAEHELELKKYKLKEAQLIKENDLTNKKVKDELKRREMQLAYDKQEIELLSKNPELMVLSPQLTRLAEASQNLRNARTVVSLSPQQISQGGQIVEMIQEFLHGVTKGQAKKK